jgi:hypothetical protein
VDRVSFRLLRILSEEVTFGDELDHIRRNTFNRTDASAQNCIRTCRIWRRAVKPAPESSQSPLDGQGAAVNGAKNSAVA